MNRFTSVATDKMNGAQLGIIYTKPLLVPHLSPDHINFIPLEDTADLMKAVSSSAQGPPIHTVRILQSRLRNYTRYKRKDILDDEELLEKVWLSNFDIYPATVTAGFRYSGSKDSNRDHHDTTSQYSNPLFTSTADLQLRFLCPSDLDQVKDLCKEWFPIQYPEAWYRDITSDPRFYSLAAVYQSKLVGLLIAEVKQSNAINKEDKGILDGRMYSNCTVGYILSLGVCSSFRRQGVASLLLDSFLTHVTQSENQICKAIYLHVLTMNSAAIRFYEKHYFRLHSFLPYYYSVDGKCKDGFTYVLYINGGHPPWGLLYPFFFTKFIYFKFLIHKNIYFP
uniref:N-alpha-acetyltransferase 60 n=1 Tax=Daphnia longispina TaxID=42846 RepID=A0A4Y7M9P3_9CRUS|nr:EOG090X0BM0 [Daphnia longispina]